MVSLYASKNILKAIDKFLDIIELCLTKHPTIPLIEASSLIGFIVRVLEEFPKATVQNKGLESRIFEKLWKLFVKIPNEISA